MRSGSPPLCGAFQLQLHFGEEDEARQVVREHCVDVAKSYNVSVEGSNFPCSFSEHHSPVSTSGVRSWWMNS